MRPLKTLLLLSLTPAAVFANVSVTNIFSDHMVLQRDIELPVWGKADPGEAVTVKLGAATAQATADPAGSWSLKLPASAANSAPQDLLIAGKNSLAFKNVLIGDVWVCSGQSNMEMALGSCNAPDDIKAANLPKIRRIKFPHVNLASPTTNVPGKWEVCNPQTAGAFTAVGFYFAKRIQQEVGVPIGLIDDSWGGTRIEPWIPVEGFEMVPALAPLLEGWRKKDAEYRASFAQTLTAYEQWITATRAALEKPGTPLPAQPALPVNAAADAGGPVSLYNGMIHPVIPYGIKGALWYQGESNGGEGDEYGDKMRALIGGWRSLWNQGEFPFYYVQLANFQQPPKDAAGGDGWARVRDAQTKAMNIPNTGMAVIIDIGEGPDIHPKNKFDVGERLARWALNKDYGKTDVVFSGPQFDGMRPETGKLRISFRNMGGGLIAGKKDGRKPVQEVPGGKLNRFSIAGEDGKWFEADAVIDGDGVLVSSPKVGNPVAVRYAYSMNPEGANLYNKAGLPAIPFRTDSW